MIAIALVLVSSGAPALQLAKCELGRVTGADAQNNAVIEGKLRFAALFPARNSPGRWTNIGEVRLFDPNHLLLKPGTSSRDFSVRWSNDGKVSFARLVAGAVTVLGIDPPKLGLGRVATVSTVQPSDGSWDPDHFYYGSCSLASGSDVAMRFEAIK